jgi:2-keto-3-deoxy-L-rhamnonate aldolase RhmA
VSHSNDPGIRSLSCVSVRLLQAHQLAPLLRVSELDAGYADLQHASFGLDEAASIARVINQSGRFGFVRLAGPTVLAAQALQRAGTEMLLIPGLDLPGDMSSFAQAAAASPENGSLKLGWMVESMAAVERIDDIVALGCTSFVMVGCTDLQRDATAQGGAHAAYVEDSLRHVIRTAHRAGKRCMVGGTWRDPVLLRTAQQEHPWLITIGSDETVIAAGAQQAVDRWAVGQPPVVTRTTSIQ